MVHENFDCLDLHEEDLKIILLSIYGTFWSSTFRTSIDTVV